jgi:hypothetical protein
MKNALWIGMLTALAVLGVAPADATSVQIFLKQTGGSSSQPWTAEGISGPTSALFDGAFGNFNLNIVSGTEVGGELLANTVNSGTTKTARGATLYVDVVETGVTTPGNLTDFLSTFTTNALPSGWTVQEFTLYGSSAPIATSVVFSGPGTDVDSAKNFVTSSPYELQDLFVIKLSSAAATGSGKSDNSTIDLSYAAVPEPSTWAMIGLGFAGVGLMGLTKRRKGTRYAI